MADEKVVTPAAKNAGAQTGGAKAQPLVRSVLNAKYLRIYRKQGTGQQVAVYTISGTPSALAAFKASQGENYKEDNETGLPLYFVAVLPGRRLHQTIKLIQTVSYNEKNQPVLGRFVVDDSADLFVNTNKFADMIMSEEAKIIAMRNLMGTNRPQNNSVAQDEMLIEEEVIV